MRGISVGTQTKRGYSILETTSNTWAITNILNVRNCLVRQNNTVAISEPSFGGLCLSWSYHTGRTPGKEPPEQKNTSRHPEINAVVVSWPEWCFCPSTTYNRPRIEPNLYRKYKQCDLFLISTVFPHGAECDSMETVHGVRMRDHFLFTRFILPRRRSVPREHRVMPKVGGIFLSQ